MQCAANLFLINNEEFPCHKQVGACICMSNKYCSTHLPNHEKHICSVATVHGFKVLFENDNLCRWAKQMVQDGVAYCGNIGRWAAGETDLAIITAITLSILA